jgi:glycosyltransferase involved in cell wall biosynthesis
MKPARHAVQPQSDRPLVVVLNNDILPYRIPLFRALDAATDLRFHFIFSTERAWDRSWRVDREQLGFRHSVLRGFALRLRKPNYGEWRTIYINPTLFLHLLRLRPDVIVGYEYSAPALTALLYTRLRRAAYVVWTDCTRYAERELTRGQRWTRRLIIPRAQAYLGTSQAACDNLVHSGAPVESVFESPMSHAVAWFRNESANARKESAPGGAHKILYVGALNKRKGVTSLLEAFAIVARQQPETRLVLIGDGPLRSSLEALARRLGVHAQVDFGGFIQPIRLPATYAQAEIFVLPSLEDTFGVVVVEAMACGVPVVCSKYAGASSHLVDGTNAFIVDPEDTAQLADRILRLQSDAGLRARFAAEGRRVARSFEASAVAEPFMAAARAALDRLRR